MIYKVIKKEDGKIMESTITKEISNSPYLDKNERCFSDILYSDFSFYKKDYIDDVDLAVSTMINQISKTPNGNNIIENLYNLLKIAENLNDLINIVNNLSREYGYVLMSRRVNNHDIRIRTDFNKYLKYEPELVISIAIKSIISTYFKNLLASMNKQDINDLYNLKITNCGVEDILHELNISSHFSCENGIEEIAKKVLLDEIDSVFFSLQKHLCREDCINASAVKCSKFFCNIDLAKITDFIYITRGSQIVDENGTTQRFIVEECDNYVQSNEKVLVRKK